jgi:hypothetical protein
MVRDPQHRINATSFGFGKLSPYQQRVRASPALVKFSGSAGSTKRHSMRAHGVLEQVPRAAVNIGRVDKIVAGMTDILMEAVARSRRER